MSDKKDDQGGFYAHPAEDDSSECPSCFYQPAAAKAKADAKKGKEEVDECPSCFYQPAAAETHKEEDEHD